MKVAKRPVVLLTGASTGLGLCLTKKLMALDQYHIIATARDSSLPRFHQAEVFESENLWVRPLDITNHGQIYDLIAESSKKLDGIDILINNAGISTRSVVEHITEKERLYQMDVNFNAPMELIRNALPKMREKRSGRIINISSVGGMMAMPTMSNYSASKFALEGASESLWYELKPFGIHVSLVQPGFINSDSFSNTKPTDLAEKALNSPTSPYHQHYKNMACFIESMMTHTISDKRSVADKIIKLMSQKNPPLRIAGTWDAFFFSALRRLLPRGLYHKVLYYSLPGIRKWGNKQNN